VTLWALLLHSRLATDCCLWTSNFAIGHHHLSAIPDGRDMPERLLRRRQGHYLPCAQLFEWLRLSSWWVARIAVALELYRITSYALQVQHWLRPDLSPSSISNFQHNPFPDSR